MARKIRLTGLGIVVTIIIAGLIALCCASSANIGEVKSVKVENVGQNSAEINWKRVGSADGYNVYQKLNDDASEYEKIGVVEDVSTLKYSVDNLQDTTQYIFCVKAYKISGEKVTESEKFKELEICTIPANQQVKLASTGEGKIKVTLALNERASGYEIECSKTEDFSDSNTIKIEDKSTIEKEISDLEVDVQYYFKARTYVEYKGDTVYGEWSEVASEKSLAKASSNVDPSKPMIAITFDDGPAYGGSSTAILDTIEKYNVRATFFMLGKNSSSNPDNLARKVKLGCEIGNHTYDHSNYGKNVSASDISSATDAISKAAGGAKVTCFRSPGGNTTDIIRAECEKEGMPLYYWSLDTEDWKSRDANKIYDAVMNNVKDGDIILMHEIYDSTAEAFERMVPELLAQGYQLVTCEELVKAKTGEAPKAGQQYVNATRINNQTS